MIRSANVHRLYTARISRDCLTCKLIQTRSFIRECQQVVNVLLYKSLCNNKSCFFIFTSMSMQKSFDSCKFLNNGALLKIMQRDAFPKSHRQRSHEAREERRLVRLFRVLLIMIQIVLQLQRESVIVDSNHF